MSKSVCQRWFTSPSPTPFIRLPVFTHSSSSSSLLPLLSSHPQCIDTSSPRITSAHFTHYSSSSTLIPLLTNHPTVSTSHPITFLSPTPFFPFAISLHPFPLIITPTCSSILFLPPFPFLPCPLYPQLHRIIHPLRCSFLIPLIYYPPPHPPHPY